MVKVFSMVGGWGGWRGGMVGLILSYLFFFLFISSKVSLFEYTPRNTKPKMKT